MVDVGGKHVTFHSLKVRIKIKRIIGAVTLDLLPMGNLAVTAWVGFTLGYVRLPVCGYTLVNRELTQRRRQRQRKRHLKINIWEMLTIFRLFLLPRILYC